MKKAITVLVAFIALIGSQSCRKMVGKGPVVSETRVVEAFNKIEAEFPGDIVLVQGPVREVKAEAQEDIIGDLYTTVSNGTLKIKIRNGLRLSNGSSLKVFVTIPEIAELSLKGSGNINAEKGIVSDNLALLLKGSGSFNISDIECIDLYSEITGSGNIKIDGGHTDLLRLRLTGSGDFKGEKFNSKDAEVSLTGSGSANIRVSDTLKATLTGSGSINYYGDPVVTQNVTGSGSVKKKG